MSRDLDAAYALLGLTPGAGAEEIAAAYRRRAKDLHPDRTGDEDDAARMAAVNAAHDVLTAALLAGAQERSAAAARPRAPARATRAARVPGHWLDRATRRALGPELVRELEEGETVHIVTPAATWASGRTTLAVTDRRVLWLLDDVVSGRVRSVPYARVAGVKAGVRGRRRRTGSVRIAPRPGRPVTFTELDPGLAQTIARWVSAAARAAGTRAA